jgi:hypothetical protein
MTDNFMVTLISNGSMRYYPNNTGNNFTNRLGEPVDLRGAVMNEDMSWEVAMADFQYTNVFEQVDKTADIRIVLMYPKVEDEEDVTREAAEEESRQQSLATNELGDTTRGSTDETLAALRDAGLVTSASGSGQPPAKKAKKVKAVIQTTPAPAASPFTSKRPYDKALMQAAREAWQKGSSTKGIGSLMFDHQIKARSRRPDTTDDRIIAYVEDKYRYRLSELDSAGFNLTDNADFAIAKIKIERGDYESPLAIAYIIAATFNMMIDQLVDRPTLNTQLRVESDVDGKISFVCDDRRVHHLFVMDDKRLAKMLGLNATPLVIEDAEPLYGVELRGSNTPWLGAYVPNMFIYCDIVTDQYVGDVMAPLLDLVPVKHSGMGERVQYSLVPPSYLEVARKFIDVVHVEIRDDKGIPVPFDDSKGAVVVRLHFRRKGVMPSFVM